MKVLHLSGAISWRGGEQQLFYLQEAVQLTDIEQFIVCPYNSELYNRLLNTPNLNLIGFRKTISINLYLAYKLKKICTKKNIDIIHAHDSHAHTYAFISAWLFGNKTPIIVHRRVAFAIGKSLFSKLKYNHKSIHKIICISKAIREIMLKYISNADILKVVHSGIDLNRFPHKSKTYKLRKLLNLSEDTFLIGNTSAIDTHKDYVTFVDTAIIILKSFPLTHFVIIGSGKLENQIIDYIKQKEITKNISLIGFRNDVPDLLPDFDIFLMTTIKEGLGTSILDAFACNVPVVSTNAGGIVEIIEHGKSGMLADIGNSEQLAQHAVQLISDVSLKQTIIKGASEKLKSFTKEKMANKIIDIYKSM